MKSISSVNIRDVEAIQMEVEPEHIGWLLLDIDKNCTRGEIQCLYEHKLSVDTLQLSEICSPYL
jgi:hypothetical protein